MYETKQCMRPYVDHLLGLNLGPECTEQCTTSLFMCDCYYTKRTGCNDVVLKGLKLLSCYRDDLCTWLVVYFLVLPSLLP